MQGKENFSDLWNSLKRQPSTSLTSIPNKRPLTQTNSQSFHQTTRFIKRHQRTTTSPGKSIEPLFIAPQTVQQRLVNTYSTDILEHQSKAQRVPHEWLLDHSLTPNLRAKMIDWMVEVLTSYKCKDQTLFLAIQIMDNYLWKSNKHHQPSDLHLLGVACMFIASKYEEIYPVKLQVVQDKIAHKKLSKEDIKNKEADILTTLEFEITITTLFEILTHMLVKLCQTFKLIKRSEIYLMKALTFVAKMVNYDYEILQKIDNHFILSGAIFIAVFKIGEKVDPTLQPDEMTQYISRLCKTSVDMLLERAVPILKLIKNFDKLYPSLENLKKFNKFSFDDY